MEINADRVRAQQPFGIVGNLTTLERKMREYITEVRPSLSDQLSLSLRLKSIRDSDDGAFEAFLNWIIKQKEEADG